MTTDPVQEPLAEPPVTESDPAALLAGFLDCYRDALLRKLDGLDDELLRGSVLPSGWSPLGLLKHLTCVERRWLRWGFLGEDVADPWRDSDPADPDAPWPVAADETYESLLADYRSETEHSRRVLAEHPLTARSALGGRFDTEPTPTLGWIALHLVQEYARHVGHLDITRELLDGTTGE